MSLFSFSGENQIPPRSGCNSIHYPQQSVQILVVLHTNKCDECEMKFTVFLIFMSMIDDEVQSLLVCSGDIHEILLCVFFFFAHFIFKWYVLLFHKNSSYILGRCLLSAIFRVFFFLNFP